MKGLLEALDKQGITFTISDAVKQFLALDGFTPKYGARQISGVIRNRLRRPISKFIVAGALKKGKSVMADLQGEEVTWNIE